MVTLVWAISRDHLIEDIRQLLDSIGFADHTGETIFLELSHNGIMTVASTCTMRSRIGLEIDGDDILSVRTPLCGGS
jgi:hypothetical protein